MLNSARLASFRAAAVVLLTAALGVGCAISLRDGVFACGRTDDCPRGFVCGPDGFCAREPSGDAGMDARLPDGATDTSIPDSGCRRAGDCDDSIPCTADQCEMGTCTHTPNDAACPGAACRTGVCDPATGCTLEVRTSGTCDDGVYCNGDDVCDSAGECVSSGDPCLAPTSCDPVRDACIGCTGPGDCGPGFDCVAMECLCGGGETTETTCDDGMDNDCNAGADCADVDCDGQACGVGGQVCVDSACTCPGGGTEICSASGDEDCDGDADCADTDCAGAACGDDGLVCSGGACGCPGTSEVCNSVGDEDCNGMSDCADSACNAMPCGSDGRICMAGTCQCPGSTELCNMPGDEDCDGDVNCADSDCSGILADRTVGSARRGLVSAPVRARCALSPGMKTATATRIAPTPIATVSSVAPTGFDAAAAPASARDRARCARSPAMKTAMG